MIGHSQKLIRLFSTSLIFLYGFNLVIYSILVVFSVIRHLFLSEQIAIELGQKEPLHTFIFLSTSIAIIIASVYIRQFKKCGLKLFLVPFLIHVMDKIFYVIQNWNYAPGISLSGLIFTFPIDLVLLVFYGVILGKRKNRVLFS